MKIHTEGPRERIMVMGAAGSGKSNAALSIASLIDNRMYVLDTGVDTYERLMWNAEQDYSNVTSYGVMPDDWEAMMDAVDQMSEKVVRDDWVVIDSVTPTWSATQSWFADKVMGDNLADMLLKARTEMKSGNNLRVFEGWTDWQTINAQYAKFMNHLLKMNARGAHLFFTAEMEALGDNDDRATRAMYGKVGAKPRGNKRLPHIPHDLIMMKRTRNEWEWEAVKAQGSRQEVTGEVNDFARQFLVGVGGWKVTT